MGRKSTTPKHSLIKRLESEGWYLVRTKGTHLAFPKHYTYENA